MHLMTGNLSHQIEHHLFPDMPSNRYAEVAPKVRELCEPLRAALHQRPPSRAITLTNQPEKIRSRKPAFH
jgi:NADPH-dependent stearoyl-CoA 9-desaturase